MPKTVRRGQERNERRIDYGRYIFILVAAGLLYWVGDSAIEFSVRGYCTAGDVVAKSAQYEALVEENERAAADLEYLQTPEGEEYAIRERLLYVREGEQLLEPVTEPPPPPGHGIGARMKAGLNARLQGMSNSMQQTAMQVKCWLGLWQPPGPGDSRDFSASEG